MSLKNGRPRADFRHPRKASHFTVARRDGEETQFVCACGRKAKSLTAFSGESGSLTTCAVCLYATPELSAAGARELASAVLMRAVEDVTSGSVESFSTREAYHFLRDEVGPLANSRRFWAHIAGLNDEAIRTRFRLPHGKAVAVETFERRAKEEAQSAMRGLPEVPA